MVRLKARGVRVRMRTSSFDITLSRSYRIRLALANPP